jgi:hypothetical protein
VSSTRERERERERGSVLRERERERQKKNFFIREELKKFLVKKSVKNVTRSAAKNKHSYSLIYYP